MSVVPTGQFSLHEEPARLELTIAGVLFGQYQVAFDRRLGVFERDGRTVCAIGQIGSIEVQAAGLGPPHVTFTLVVVHPGGTEYLYQSENKEAVAELAARIAEFLGVQVTHREQPLQRQVREAIGDVLPDALRSPSPTRLPTPIAGALSLGRALSQAFAGLMLMFMGALIVTLAPPQNSLPAIGWGIGALGLLLLAHAAYRATRTVKSGAFSPGAATTMPFTKAEAARFAPRSGASHGAMGLFALVGRTDLVFGLVFVAIGVGVVVLIVVTQGRNAPAMSYVVGLIFAAVGGFMTWQSVKKIGVWRAIQASPLAVEAVVQDIRQVNRRPLRFALDYRYQAPAGTAHVAQSFPLSPAEADPWRRLDVAAVVVNRHCPEQSMLAALRPIRHSTREERYPDGNPQAPSH